MIKNKELSSRSKDYTKIRRIAWIAMGFCPNCMNKLDSFPNNCCNNCKFENKKRYIHNNWPSTRRLVNGK